MTYAQTIAAPAGSIFELESIIRRGDSVPLSWVVKYRDRFELDYETADIKSALFIAGHVLPRRRLVLGSVCVVRGVLKNAAAGEVGPLHVVETIERWLAGEASVKEVELAAASVPFSRRSISDLFGAKAVESNVDIAVANVAQVVSRNLAAAAAAAANATVTQAIVATGTKKTRSLCRRVRAIMRSHIRLTVAEVISAGKRGWLPE